VSRRAAVPALGLLLTAGLVLAACGGQDGLSLAQQACAHVSASIQAYEAAQGAPNAQAADQDSQRATAQLAAALPLAAAANSDDGNWNDLMTTIQEMGRVDEGHLLGSLRAACMNVQTDTPGVPVEPPSNLPVEPGEPRTTSTTTPTSTSPASAGSSTTG
jgi:hypothetical protein